MRIPTYSFKKSSDGLEVYGPGTQTGDIFPNLVFVRDKEFRFLFWDESSVIELFDNDNNVLFSGSVDQYYDPVIFKFGKNYPNQIRYRFKNASVNEYGNIIIRDIDNISGKVISYGYSKNTSVTDNKSQTLTTNDQGKFSLNLNNRILSEYDTYFVNFDLYSSGGFDASVLNINEETYSDELSFSFKAKTGSMHISSMSTLFWYIHGKLIKTNYREAEAKMQRYFNLSNRFDPITDDPIFGYLTNKILLTDFVRYILLTCIIEYESIIHKDSENLNDKFSIYDKLTDEILDENKKFSFVTLNNLISKNDTELSNSFISAFLVLSGRLFQLSDKKIKKVCVLESIYSLVYKFRNAIFKNIISYEMFLSDDFSVTQNSIAVPRQSYTMLVSYINGCSVAPFGKYAKIDITSELIRSVLNQSLPTEPEITNELLDKTLYIKYNSSDYFCYKILDYIDYDYELEEIKSEQIMHGFENSLDCCTLETISAQSLQEKNISLELNVPTETLFDIRLFSIEKIELVDLEITNKNKPYMKSDDISDNEKFYLDEHLSKRNDFPVPAFVVVTKQQTKKLKNKDGISIAYDGRIKNYLADHIRYDYNVIDINNVMLAPDNNILTFDTSYEHGYSRGEIIVIKNSSKEMLNGEFEIVGATSKSITIEFDLPEGKTKKDIDDSYGQIESLNFTKIYTDVRDFAMHDILFFEHFNGGVGYVVSSIQQDYLGSYLVVSGVVPRNCKNFTRKSRIPVLKTMKYSRSRIPEIYDLRNSDGSLIDLEIYDVFTPSHPGTVAAAASVNIISNIEFSNMREIIEIIEPENDDVVDFSVKRNKTRLPVVTPPAREINIAIAYHYSRDYLRKNYELEGHEDTSSVHDTWDWNGDGVVGRDELKILERVIMTRPKTVEEYNLNRENYPRATTLPNYNTAQYACQQYCCHDDYTEMGEFSIDDVYIYDAFQAYMDKVGQTTRTDEQQYLDHYDSLEIQGLSPWLFDEMVYLPTAPSEQKLCGDYTNSGTISPEDAHIYYAHQLYYQERGEKPDSLYRFSRYYDSLVDAGIVPQLINFPEKLPSLASEDTIMGADADIPKGCEEAGAKDLVIYMTWLAQGKPTDIDQFNRDARSFTSAIPTACFLPVDQDDYAPDEYEDFGFSSFTFDEVNVGLENL